MKYLLLYLFFFSSAFSLWSQKSPATLFFKDGTSQTGYVFGDTSWDVRFGKERKGKKVDYEFEELDSLYITENNVETRYHIQRYKYGKNQKKLKNLKYAKVQLLVDGPVQLYIRNMNVREAGSTQFSYGNNGSKTTTVTSGGGYSEYSIFVKRADEERLFWLSSNAIYIRNFKKAAKEYFGDCADIILKLDSGEFHRKNINELVEFYNSQCKQQ